MRFVPRRLVLPAVIVLAVAVHRSGLHLPRGHAVQVLPAVRDAAAVLLVLLAAVIVAMTARVVSPGRMVTRVCEDDDGELDLAPLDAARIPRVLPSAPCERVPETARPERHLKAVK